MSGVETEARDREKGHPSPDAPVQSKSGGPQEGFLGSGFGRGDGRHCMGASEVRVPEQSAVFAPQCQSTAPKSRAKAYFSGLRSAQSSPPPPTTRTEPFHFDLGLTCFHFFSVPLQESFSLDCESLKASV